ncbi:BCCT family transporter, partial [Escherichia coli]|uniref:BCCT family transporter n=1 Tax=Escherichia coli TaxID=562 RepID=UPI00191C0991
IHFHLAIGVVMFTVLVFVLGFFMSLGKAAVYKHIPVYYPGHVGAVGGVVGMIGGLGGFILPIVFGALNDAVGIWSSCFMLLFVLVAGPTVFLLQTFVQNTGAYLSDIVNKTFNLYAYEPTDWIGGWTLFYLGWWIAWSPFVGLFIARISRGRTIREFVSGVLLVPAGFTLFWMTVFGDT